MAIVRTRALLGAVLFGFASLHAQSLTGAQVVSRKLAGTPIPNDISVNGRVDNAIPPLLERLKLEIRNWLSAVIDPLPLRVDCAQLQKSLTADFRQAGLLWNEKDGEVNPFGKLLGIGVSPIAGEPNLLQVIVRYDSFCPPDDSVLFFERRRDGRWHLLLNFDNTDFIAPWGERELLYAGVSPRDETGQFYFFVARTRSYCPGSGSRFNGVNYHVLRPAADPESPRVLLAEEHEYLENEDCRILLRPRSLTMDFPDWSAITASDRTEILTYEVGADIARRIEPISVNVEGFVEEWMASPWSSAREWTAPESRSTLRAWHEQLDTEKSVRSSKLGDEAFRQFCSTDRKLVQITYPAEYPTDGPKPGDLFFLVRESGPHRYRLVRISKESAPSCSKPRPDESYGEHLLPESMNRRADKLVPDLP